MYVHVHCMYNMSVNNDDPQNRTLFNLIKITLVYPLNPLWLLDSVSYRNLVLIRLENQWEEVQCTQHYIYIEEHVILALISIYMYLVPWTHEEDNEFRLNLNMTLHGIIVRYSMWSIENRGANKSSNFNWNWNWPLEWLQRFQGQIRPGRHSSGACSRRSWRWRCSRLW